MPKQEFFHSIFLLLPLGAGLILGVYVTVRVTISRTCRTLGLLIRGDLTSKCLASLLLLKSQSNGERALNGDRIADVADVAHALKGVSTE